MKNILLYIALILFIAILVRGQRELNKGEELVVTPTKISAEEAFDMYEKGSAFWVDVRNEKEYLDGHIKGAINIPLDNVEADIEKLPKEKVIVLNCSGGEQHSDHEHLHEGGSCAASLSAGRILINKGYEFDDVKVLDGGYEIWEKKGYPIEK